MKKILLFPAFLFCFTISHAQVWATVNVNPDAYPCDSCFTFSVSTQNGTPPYNCQWNFSGDTTTYSTIDSVTYCYPHSPSASDTLYLRLTDANFQIGYGFLTMNFLYSISLETPSICLVTVDGATGKNSIFWDQNADTTVASYNIYKETTISGVYALSGNVSRNSFSNYIDMASNPAQVSARYKMTLVNSCGYESPQGPQAKTVHLTVSAGMGSAWNLAWDNAEGFSVVEYRIWRGLNSLAMVLIDSVQSSLNAYTDLTPPGGQLYYSLEAISSTACNPTMRLANSSQSIYSSSFSNLADNGVSGISNNSLETQIQIFPNPFSTITTINVGQKFSGQILEFEMYDVLGNLIQSYASANGKFEIEKGNISSGIYFYKIICGGSIVGKGKLMVE